MSTANQHSITALCGNREEDVDWRCSRDANEVKAGLEATSDGKRQAATGHQRADTGGWRRISPSPPTPGRAPSGTQA